MAARGRKPKPTALKILEGNLGKRPLNTGEPTPLSAVSACPDWLEDEAKAEWARMGEILENMGILTEIDVTVEKYTPSKRLKNYMLLYILH